MYKIDYLLKYCYYCTGDNMKNKRNLLYILLLVVLLVILPVTYFFISNNYFLMSNKKLDESLNNLRKLSEDINLDQQKYDSIIEYVSYLNEHKDEWKYENNKFLCKNVNVLNTIKEKNKELGINNKVIMEQRSNKNIPVLMYHGVSDTTWGIASLFMRVADFESQLKYIHDNYETIFIEDIEDYYGDKKVVVLTFDDGYVDFYTNVLPLLKKYNIKANLYIITGATGEKFLSEEQILEINNSGLVSIGSHTVNHSNLASLGEEELNTELKDSKEYLEKLLGKEIKTICYPYGSHNSKVLEEVPKYYEYGIAIGGSLQTMNNDFNNVAIKRFGVYRNTGFNNFKKMVDLAT